MKPMFILSALILCSLSVSLAQTPGPDAILGIWQTATKDGKISVYKSGTTYAGKLIWGVDLFERDGITSKKDVHNPDVALRQRPLQNLIILTGFSYRDGVWDGGTIYDPQSGKTYRSTIKLKTGKLDIRGYIGLSLFGKTVTWNRVD